MQCRKSARCYLERRRDASDSRHYGWPFLQKLPLTMSPNEAERLLPMACSMLPCSYPGFPRLTRYIAQKIQGPRPDAYAGPARCGMRMIYKALLASRGSRDGLPLTPNSRSATTGSLQRNNSSHAAGGCDTVTMHSSQAKLFWCHLTLRGRNNLTRLHNQRRCRLRVRSIRRFDCNPLAPSLQLSSTPDSKAAIWININVRPIVDSGPQMSKSVL